MHDTRLTSVAALLAVLTVTGTGPSAQEPTPASQPRSTTTRTLDPQPLSFEENRGQADTRVRYMSRARDYAIALTDDEAILLLRKQASAGDARRGPSREAVLLRMRLAGAARLPRITARDPLPGKVYYADANANGRLRPVDTFGRLEYSDIYPGIDLVYYGDDRQLEFDFIVAPYADPDRIALSLEGADVITLTESGDLTVRVDGTEVRLRKPVVYQIADAGRVEIPGTYQLAGASKPTVRFQLGDYDPSLPLVIDPTWMTTFGSTSEDGMTGFEVDSAGQPRLLGMTFDPASFPFNDVEPGVLPPPNCFLTKLASSGLRTYTILFKNTARCENLALAPSNVTYFTGFVYPNGFPNNRGTTVTAIDDSSGVPVVSRFVVGNYDSSAIGEGVDAIAVNGLGHVFLLGPCRLLDPGEPALELSGYNETLEPAHDIYEAGCRPASPGLTSVEQPLLTVVDNSGEFLYGSFLSPGELVTKYALAADDTDRAYILGAQSTTVVTTADAYRSGCPSAGTRGFDSCGYLMVLDTTTTGANSLLYASYLWNTENVGTVVIRLHADGAVTLASEGRVFVDFPSNRPPNQAGWPYSLYPSLTDGIQLARFGLDATTGAPSQLDFALVFDPSRAVAALAGLTVRESLAGLRLFPSGALAVASVAYTTSLAPLGVVTTFHPNADRLGQNWTQNLATRTPVGFDIALDSAGNLFLAGQVDRIGAGDTDVFVERIDAAEPTANQPPTVSLQNPFGGTATTVYADSPSGGTVNLYAVASDPDGDQLTYSWNGPFIGSPSIDGAFLAGRLPVGPQQVVTVTVDDGHGNIVSASLSIDVVGTPFVGATATPIDSELNGLIYNYAPVTITATAIGTGPNNAYLQTRLDRNPPIPSDLQAGSPPIYFDVSTDAALIQPPIQVCVDTRGMSFPIPGSVRLYHYRHFGQLAAWFDITSTGFPQGNQLCGQADTFGTFAILYPQVPPTAVQTIAGNGVRMHSNDGPGGSPADDYVDGPATSTALDYLHGGAYDRVNNRLFVSDGSYILRLNLNNSTIARVAGNGVIAPGSIDGSGGDPRDDLVEAGDAFNTYVGFPAEMAVSPAGDLVFFDRNTCRIRRLDQARNQLFAVAGNGVCGFSGDGFSAALASISYGQMAFDAAGNLFLADSQHARVRRIDAVTHIISTVAGDGSFGIPVDGTPALSTIGPPTGIAFDSQGYLLLASGMHLLRISTGATDTLVNGDADETIKDVGGCNTNCQTPFNGDGLPISHPQVYLPGMGALTVAQDGAVLFPDYFRIRRIAPGADGVVTGAADEIVATIGGYYDWATVSQISNFNGDTFSTQSLFSIANLVVDDTQGRIIVVDGNNYRVRRFGLAPPPVDPNSVELAISVQGSPDPVETGASLRYFVTVTNNGPATATGVTMTYDMPAGAEFVSSVSRGGATCPITPPVGSSGRIQCTFGTLASGGSDTVPITITANVAGPLSSSFSVASDQVDSNTANNATTVTTMVAFAPAVITVTEVIAVTDAVNVLPSATLEVVETITVQDSPSLLPSAMLGVDETIVVTDTPGVASNAPPTVDAGPDQVVEATAANGATVTVTGTASDPDGDPLTLTWSGPCGTAATASAALTCSLGSHTLTLTVSDTRGGVVSDTVSVTVGDTTRPELTAPITVFASATSDAGATVSYNVSATDIVSGPVVPSCSPASGATFAIGGTTVTCTATDAAGNVSTRLVLISVVSDTALRLPGSLRVPATSASGAVVTYSAFARAIYGGDTTDYAAFCSPESGSTFPIGTTTVSCFGFQFFGTPPTGSFTVTVDVGTPTLTAIVANKGRDAAGSVWIDLRLTNTGSGHARNITLSSLALRTLSGTGSVTYDASRSGPLPLQVGSLDVGQTRTVRLYMNVPATVARFSVTEGITFQNVIGTTLTYSAGQAVIP